MASGIQTTSTSVFRAKVSHQMSTRKVTAGLSWQRSSMPQLLLRKHYNLKGTKKLSWIAQCLTQQSLQFFSESTCNQKYISPQSLNKLAVCKVCLGQANHQWLLDLFQIHLGRVSRSKNPRVPRIRNELVTEVRLSINSWRWLKTKPPGLLKMAGFFWRREWYFWPEFTKKHRVFLLLLFWGGKLLL